MPAKEIRVNLLGSQDLLHSPWGRIITWATSWGRYIMITTEIVVLLAFISRFTLDRQLTDLKEEISQKQTIIEANRAFENEIRTIQSQLVQIKTIIERQTKPVDMLTLVQAMLPPDVYLESFQLDKNKLTLNATAGTSNGFAQFIANVTSRKELSNASIGDIKRDSVLGVQFQLTVNLAPDKTATPSKGR